MPQIPAKRLSLAVLAALLRDSSRKLDRKLDRVIAAQAENHVVTELLKRHQTISRVDTMWQGRQQSRALLWAGIIVPSVASIAGVVLAIILSVHH